MRLRRSSRRLGAVSGVLGLALGLSACGNKESFPTHVDNEGTYVTAGRVAYQVQISRQLNPASLEDRTYLTGQSSPPPRPDEEWFGVFLWAKNFTHTPLPTTGSVNLIDASGIRYFPIPLNPKVNPFAWTPQILRPLQTSPTAGTAASYGPTQGGELLFKVNLSVYANRPLQLVIHSPGQPLPSTVTLDL